MRDVSARRSCALSMRTGAHLASHMSRLLGISYDEKAEVGVIELGADLRSVLIALIAQIPDKGKEPI